MDLTILDSTHDVCGDSHVRGTPPGYNFDTRLLNTLLQLSQRLRLRPPQTASLRFNIYRVTLSTTTNACNMSTKVPTRKLGKNGPAVSALGFGTMGLSAFYGKPRSDEERLAFLDHIYAAGETHWDSADAYGDSEDLLGK